eukprot:6214734-Pleurochrysis_carterae.AAC.3
MARGGDARLSIAVHPVRSAEVAVKAAEMATKNGKSRKQADVGERLSAQADVGDRGRHATRVRNQKCRQLTKRASEDDGNGLGESSKGDFEVTTRVRAEIGRDVSLGSRKQWVTKSSGEAVKQKGQEQPLESGTKHDSASGYNGTRLEWQREGATCARRCMCALAL